MVKIVELKLNDCWIIPNKLSVKQTHYDIEQSSWYITFKIADKIEKYSQQIASPILISLIIGLRSSETIHIRCLLN